MRRLTIETPAPKIEPLRVDSFLFAECSPAHAALCMLINKGTPVAYSLFSAHHVTSCVCTGGTITYTVTSMEDGLVRRLPLADILCSFFGGIVSPAWENQRKDHRHGDRDSSHISLRKKRVKDRHKTAAQTISKCVEGYASAGPLYFSYLNT